MHRGGVLCLLKWAHEGTICCPLTCPSRRQPLRRPPGRKQAGAQGPLPGFFACYKVGSLKAQKIALGATLAISTSPSLSAPSAVRPEAASGCTGAAVNGSCAPAATAAVHGVYSAYYTPYVEYLTSVVAMAALMLRKS